MGAIPADYAKECAPVVPLSDVGSTIARIECAQCGAKGEWRIAGRRPPASILPKHFGNQGWRLGKRPTCPDCQQSNRKDEEPVVQPAENVTPVKSDQAPSDNVKALRRKANEHLMAYFDVDAGRYDDGWSDERVANESGMPIAWVAKRREEEYGSLKEPAEFVELRGRVAALAVEMGKLVAKVDDMARRNGWKN